MTFSFHSLQSSASFSRLHCFSVSFGKIPADERPLKRYIKRLPCFVQAVFDSLPEIIPCNHLKSLLERKEADFEAFRGSGGRSADRFCQKERIAHGPRDILIDSAELDYFHIHAAFLLRLPNGRFLKRFSLFDLAAWHFPAPARPLDQ